MRGLGFLVSGKGAWAAVLASPLLAVPAVLLPRTTDPAPSIAPVAASSPADSPVTPARPLMTEAATAEALSSAMADPAVRRIEPTVLLTIAAPAVATEVGTRGAWSAHAVFAAESPAPETVPAETSAAAAPASAAPAAEVAETSTETVSETPQEPAPVEAAAEPLEASPADRPSEPSAPQPSAPPVAAPAPQPSSVASATSAAPAAAADVPGLPLDIVPPLAAHTPETSAQVPVPAAVAPAVLESGWPLFLGGSPAQPALGDIDGDGAVEVVTVTLRSDGVTELRALEQDGAASEGWWPVQVPGALSTPALCDLDGDGAEEILVMSAPAHGLAAVQAFSGDGRPLPGWPVALNGGGVLTPAAGDVDGDGIAEVVVVSLPHAAGDAAMTVSVLRADASVLASWPAEAAAATSPVLVDVDADGELEILLTMDGAVHAWHGAGDLAAGWPQAAGDAAPVAGDLDQDGAPEIVAFPYAYHHDGTAVASWTVPADAQGSGTVLGDLTGDGTLEVVVWQAGQDALGRLAVLDASGILLASWADADTRLSRPEAIALADLDRDGLPEILVSAAAPDAATGMPGALDIFAWHGDASPVSGWHSKAHEAGEGYTPVVVAELEDEAAAPALVVASSPFEPEAHLSTGVYVWAVGESGAAAR
jgi:hypothetical protein